VHPIALPEGGRGVVLFFMIKQKNIRDKMRYSNLSNNMMISELHLDPSLITLSCIYITKCVDF
jgi:hypothetical protein